MANVHQVIGNFAGLSEFWSYHDACGPDAVLMGCHTINGLPLTGPEVDAMRNDMLRRGLFAPGGCTLGECRQYLLDTGWHIDAYAPFGSGQESSVHPLMRRYAGITPIVVQVLAAHNLPGNEGAVNSHFVAVGGIDSILGYWTGNGDDVNALASHNGHGKVIPCRWITWNQYLGAAITGCFAFSKSGVTPRSI